MAQPESTSVNGDSRELNGSCFDLLLIELVPMSYRIEFCKFMDRDEGKPSTDRKWEDLTKEQQDKFMNESLGVGGVGGGAPVVDAEELRERVLQRLDGQGFRVGRMLAERYTRDMPRLQDNLERMKFVCKDLWMVVFRKQVDNLKTNHRGIFVLSDNTFAPIKRASLERGRDTATIMDQAQAFLYFHSGVIRGALHELGMECTVQAESTELPSVTFHIRTVGAKP